MQNYELTCLAQALDMLLLVLIPRRSGPLPPLLHCGYPYPVEKLEELVATKFGHAMETAEHGFSFTSMVYRLEEAIGHTANLKIVWGEGQELDFLSLCTNYVRSPKVSRN